MFPVEIQLEILSYVPLLDKLEYARCNRSLCHELMKRVRVIKLRKERIEYLTSESFRNEISGLIIDPYEQLELKSNYPHNRIELSESSLLGLNIVVRTLSFHVNIFPVLFSRITNVQHLMLTWERGDGEISIPQISGLRELSLTNYPHSSLASLSPSFQLNQQLDLGSLRYLELFDCPSLLDVNSLGRIYELHLSFCSALVDISCLNHNKIIEINSCPVVDYSQSFRFSSVITVGMSEWIFHGNTPAIKSINLDHLEAVQSLTINFDFMEIADPLSYIQVLPPSLRYLSLKRLNSGFHIPPCHNLKELIISDCKNVSLQNLDKIRVVRIERCHEITDWSPLRMNVSVEISYCDGFKSGKHFTNVKKLTFTNNTLIKMEDLTNITHLKLLSPFFGDRMLYISSSAQGDKLFSTATTLQEMEWELYSNRDSLFDSIVKSSQLMRIVIHKTDELNYTKFEAYHQLIVKKFGRFYEKLSKSHRKLVLLKREQIKENEERLFSSLVITSMFNRFVRR